jgi:hypothetical protein
MGKASGSYPASAGSAGLLVLLHGASAAVAGSKLPSGPPAVVQVVISSSFESAVGVSQLAQLAAAADASWAASAPPQASPFNVGVPYSRSHAGATSTDMWTLLVITFTVRRADCLSGVSTQCWVLQPQAAAEPPLAHGLGTARWFADDLAPPPAAANTVRTAATQPTMASLGAAAERGLLSAPFAPAQISSHRTAVSTADGDYEFGWTLTAPPGISAAAKTDCGAAFGAHSSGSGGRRQLVVLLHGFLGAPADWAPVAQVLCPACHPFELDCKQRQYAFAGLQLTWHVSCFPELDVGTPFLCRLWRQAVRCALLLGCQATAALMFGSHMNVSGFGMRHAPMGSTSCTLCLCNSLPHAEDLAIFHKEQVESGMRKVNRSCDSAKADPLTSQPPRFLTGRGRAAALTAVLSMAHYSLEGIADAVAGVKCDATPGQSSQKCTFA